MPRLYSVFDTNLYRGLNSQAIRQLRIAERSTSVQAIASPWVALELLARVVDGPSANVRAARAALNRLVEHCRIYNGSQYAIPTIGTVDQQIAYSLLGRGSGDVTIQAVGSYVNEVVATDGNSVTVFDWAEEIRNYVRNVERSFANNIWNNVIKAAVPEAQNWQALARSQEQLSAVITQLDSIDTLRILARNILAQAEQPESDTVPLARCDPDWLIGKCPKPLLLYLRLIREVLTRGLDLNKSRNSNTIWDIRIVVAAVIFASLDPRQICLVTNDRMVLAAATSVGCADIVLSFEQYRSHMGSAGALDVNCLVSAGDRVAPADLRE